MSTVRKTQGRFKKVWGAPIVLAVLGLVGLVAALIGDGAMDVVSYALLAVQLVVIVWYVAKRIR